MCCNEIRNNLHGYASGKLNELESHSTAKHLKSCDKCRRELEEIRAMKIFLKSDLRENVTPPLDLKSGIMASINLNKYKKVYKNTLGELANWGMSLVAAGLILLFASIGPADNIVQVRNDWDNAREGIRDKIYQPFSSINERLDKFTDRITQLDGITGRMEREKEGGN
ncbi:MAG TPA: zf-HC2 domain-containing protein [Clostridia bacterium]|nr:zf-HC2 domain-containing protein [Clostridia bacterium]